MKEVYVMRLFETLILITLLLSLLSFFVSRGKRPRWTDFLPSLAVLLVLAHLVLEGYRWQMIPAYALIVFTFLPTSRAIIQGSDPQDKPSSRGRRALTIIGTVLGLLVLSIAVALVVLSPAYRFQNPTEARAGETRIRPADGMLMVYVPTGEFEMGNSGLNSIRRAFSPRDRERIGFGVYVFADERPQHPVYLDAFWIDQTEVTVAMFRTFVEDTGYETTAERQGWGKPWAEGTGEQEWPHIKGADWQHPHGPESTAVDDHPVTQVSWEDSAAYCAWAGGQLPTEAQWEKACRGVDGRMWPWGNIYDANRVSSCEAQCPIERWKDDRFDDGYAFTAPVGSFPEGASPYGAVDMAGNLWEWVADWYADDYYSDSPYENPLGPDSGTVRAMRGGAWYNTDVWLTCSARHQNPASDLYDDLGFRCAVPDQP
jgi:formylglycine-generating enzyme required for sulfatase activity